MNPVDDAVAILKHAKASLAARHAALGQAIHSEREGAEARTRELADARVGEDAKVRSDREQEAAETVLRYQQQDAIIAARRAAEDAETAARKRKIHAYQIELSRVVGAVAALNLLETFPPPGPDEEMTAAHRVVTTLYSLMHLVSERLAVSYVQAHFEPALPHLQKVFEHFKPQPQAAAGE